jgi:hypothetical protein
MVSVCRAKVSSSFSPSPVMTSTARSPPSKRSHEDADSADATEVNTKRTRRSRWGSDDDDGVPAKQATPPPAKGDTQFSVPQIHDEENNSLDQCFICNRRAERYRQASLERRQGEVGHCSYSHRTYLSRPSLQHRHLYLSTRGGCSCFSRASILCVLCFAMLCSVSSCLFSSVAVL